MHYTSTILYYIIDNIYDYMYISSMQKQLGYMYIYMYFLRYGDETFFVFLQIMTFDEKGVSHHPNHVAISKAVK